eukprot:CAMPEP_0185454468 /NCGR_PEP_ID=MMETSP1365-20130426/72769_1 /TAXON_ID=38817 /ORGANISM="Gephyrocapsa oceanica, Strain RCC1303" /LENGTH=40 /DNA_ID= /DNA_START= /DNA_END= /DNA_ORIENTATION=
MGRHGEAWGAWGGMEGEMGRYEEAWGEMGEMGKHEEMLGR